MNGYQSRRLQMLFPIELEARMRACGMLDHSTMTQAVIDCVLVAVKGREAKHEKSERIA
jgi:hypothetical protein